MDELRKNNAEGAYVDNAIMCVEPIIDALPKDISYIRTYIRTQGKFARVCECVCQDYTSLSKCQNTQDSSTLTSSPILPPPPPPIKTT